MTISCLLVASVVRGVLLGHHRDEVNKRLQLLVVEAKRSHEETLLRDKFLVQIFELLQAVFVLKQLLYRAILF